MKSGQSNSEATVLNQHTTQSLKGDHLRKVQAQIETFVEVSFRAAEVTIVEVPQNEHLLCCKI